MTRPNVITILADDLGYSDLGAFGGEIDTPNLDRLAERGTRMTSFYVTPRCSPSRAALLTGRHPHSVGVGILTRDDRPNGYPGALSTTVPTVAQLLKEQGYSTALIGKWHLSSDVDAPNDTWPTRRGFDEYYGFLPGCGSYFQPRLHRGEERVPAEELASNDYYFTDDIAERAVDFIDRCVKAAAPFFLYFAHSAPHWPLHAKEGDAEKYRARFARGWDRLRAERFKRQHDLGLGLTPSLPPRDDEVPAWEWAGDHQWEVERMSVYAAQVEAMDRAIGRVLDVLDRLHVADGTLITFSSDNGACAENLQGPGGWTPPATICPPLTRTGVPVAIGNRPEVMPGPEETYASYGRSWANLSNTPFRLYKRWVHEGGISSPFIAAWPGGGIPAGFINRTPGHVVDMLATVLDATSVNAEVVTAGDSLLPVLRGDVRAEERTLYWEHLGNAAVRRGPWKLVREASGPWELYDVDADRGETEDRSAEQPELVTELEALWRDWADANGVIPWEKVVADYAARGIPEAVNR